jgi:hypothetical protein
MAVVDHDSLFARRVHGRTASSSRTVLRGEYLIELGGTSCRENVSLKTATSKVYFNDQTISYSMRVNLARGVKPISLGAKISSKRILP